ncbi:MAG: SDR family oxidoreductase [Halioglobus sp.]|nr:SDR family oxidoreductase [Halioglobus sp.]MCB1708450.1 SDR family oxidoreductase [Halioglobus sp.]MCP5121945.1 SDR family oxidoreductase [Pseudomonadales bacterium]MCP5192516.1 SDR family oxidoreductase [Pseudomonadales bacterium]
MGIYAMTGGATGIGAAIKQRLREEGNQVIVVDIKDADIIADLSSRAGREAAVTAVRAAAADGLDGLITCAGLGSNVPNCPLITQVNYFGTVEIIAGLKDSLAAKRGAIVLISSNSAPMNRSPEFVDLLLSGNEAEALRFSETIAAQEVYSGTKQAVARWMRRHVADYAAVGIRMNAVAPGYTQTPMTEQVEKDPTYGAAIREFMASIPVGFPGKPEDQAAATSFLLRPESRFICGSVLYVDGGHDAVFRPDQV